MNMSLEMELIRLCRALCGLIERLNVYVDSKSK
jgi:hypothetical protein